MSLQNIARYWVLGKHVTVIHTILYRKEKKQKEKTTTITINLYIIFNLMVMDHGT